MTSLRRTRRIAPLVPLVLLLAAIALPVRAHAQANDRLVNSSGHAVKYKPSGSGTWLLLNPGAAVDLTEQMDVLNESFASALLTMQRLTASVYATTMTPNLDPGASGTISAQGAVCTTGRWVVTQYSYSSQYIGNLYGRALLVPISAPVRSGAPSPGDDYRISVVNPVVTVWGFESYSLGSRLEMTTMDQIKTAGYVTLVGSTDPTCTTASYVIEFAGEYINWDNNGVVTTRTMPCASSTSLPAVHPAVLASLVGGLGVLAAVASRRRRAA